MAELDEEGKALSKLIAQSLIESSPESTDTGVASRLRTMMEPGSGMTHEERLRYLEDMGLTASEQPAEAPVREDTSTLARMQAIYDMELEAQKRAQAEKDKVTLPAKQQESLVEGVTNMFKSRLKAYLSNTEVGLDTLRTDILENIKKRAK